MKKPRLVIIGAGGAAFAAAIEAAKYDIEILIISKKIYRKSAYGWSSGGGCTWKTHGFNAAVSVGDTVEAHIADTIKGGAYANNPVLAATLCQGALDLVSWLSDLGINFDMQDNTISARPFGGNGVPRSVFIEDRLGFYIQKTFNEQIDHLLSTGKVSILENFRALKILKGLSGEVAGVSAFNIDTLECIDIRCSALILADGGGASMYSPSAASFDKSCDGINMALEAGANVIDMEFVQFHPTGIASDVLVFDGSLVEEVLRFDGAKLLNKHGSRFMFEYNPLGEIATRDEVSRGIYSEIIKGNGYANNAVALDISACKDVIAKKYPALHERLSQAGYDIGKSSAIYVRPTAHFLMGGVQINELTETSIPGLYAAGETAGGVHGANRLGGNGLSEAMVFGRIAGENAAQMCLAKAITYTPITNATPLRFKTNRPTYTPDILLNQLKKEMYWNAGPVRSLEKLNDMQNIIIELNEKSNDISLGTGSSASFQIQQYFDLKNLLQASEMIIIAAMLRNESRGSHFLVEYKETSETFTGIKFSCKEGVLSHEFYNYNNQLKRA